MYCLSSQLEKNSAVLEPFEQGVEKTIKGNYLGAIKAFDRALSVSPNSADIYGYRCVACHKLGDNEGRSQTANKPPTFTGHRATQTGTNTPKNLLLGFRRFNHA